MLDAAYAEYVDAAGLRAGVELVDAADNTVMTAHILARSSGWAACGSAGAMRRPAVVDVLNRVRGAVQRLGRRAGGGDRGAGGAGLGGERSRAHNTECAAEADRGAARRRPASRSGRARAISCWPISATTGARRGGRRVAAGRGIIVRGVGGYGLPHCLRITVGTGRGGRGWSAEALAAFMRHAAGG